MASDKKIKDVMVGIFEYPHIPYWISIDQAMRIIKVSFISTKKYPEPLAILVFDEKYNLLGTLTLRGILRGLEPKFMRTPTEKAQVVEEDETALSLFKSLKEIVHFYNTRDVLGKCEKINNPKPGENCWPEPEVSANMNREELGKLGLTDKEEEDIVAFLRTLSDGYLFEK